MRKTRGRGGGIRLPGFEWDPRTKVARFEVIVPGTRAKVRRRTTVEADTRDAALEEWRRFRAAALADRPARVPHTLRTYYAAHGAAIRAALSPSGARAVDDAVARLLRYLGDTPLSKINDAAVRDLVGFMRRDGYDLDVRYKRGERTLRRRFKGAYSPWTINNTLTTLRKILRDALDREEIDRYPLRRRLPMEKVPALRLELSDEERAAFLGAFDDRAAFDRRLARTKVRGKVVASPCYAVPRAFGGSIAPGSEGSDFYFARFRWLRPLFVVALETGLSRGDLLGLRWSDVNLREGWIRVPRTKTKVEATIPLSPACRAALDECKGRDVVGARVFLTEEGAPIPLGTVVRYFELAKALAGIERRFRFHDLRHSLASRLASRGVSIQIIARVLGHSSTRMAERYARPSEESLRVVVEALSQSSDSNSAANSEAPEPERPAAAAAASGSAGKGLDGGRCRTRTDDILRVRQALYRLS